MGANEDEDENKDEENSDEDGGYIAFGAEKGEIKKGLLAQEEKTGFPRLVEAL